MRRWSEIPSEKKSCASDSLWSSCSNLLSASFPHLIQPTLPPTLPSTSSTIHHLQSTIYNPPSAPFPHLLPARCFLLLHKRSAIQRISHHRQTTLADHFRLFCSRRPHKIRQLEETPCATGQTLLTIPHIGPFRHRSVISFGSAACPLSAWPARFRSRSPFCTSFFRRSCALIAFSSSSRPSSHLSSVILLS